MSEDGRLVIEARYVVNIRSYHEVVSAKCSYNELSLREAICCSQQPTLGYLRGTRGANPKWSFIW